MSKPEFFRGARLRPAEKPQESLQGRLAQEIPYHQFIVYIAHTAITEYGVKDRDRFLLMLGAAFDSILSSNV